MVLIELDLGARAAAAAASVGAMVTMTKFALVLWRGQPFEAEADAGVEQIREEVELGYSVF